MVPRAMGLRGGSPGGGQASGRGNPGEGGAARVWGLFGGGSHTFGGEWGRSWLRSPPRRRTRRVNLSLPQLRPHGRLPTQSRPNSGAPPRATRAPAPSLLPSRPFSLAISAPYPSPCPYSPYPPQFCPFDHVHCHFCRRAGHRALECDRFLGTLSPDEAERIARAIRDENATPVL